MHCCVHQYQSFIDVLNHNRFIQESYSTIELVTQASDSLASPNSWCAVRTSVPRLANCVNSSALARSEGQSEVTASLLPCRVQTLSWRPRAYLWHSFLTADECQHIMRLAKPQVPSHKQHVMPHMSPACWDICNLPLHSDMCLQKLSTACRHLAIAAQHAEPAFTAWLEVWLDYLHIFLRVANHGLRSSTRASACRISTVSDTPHL